LNIFLNSFGCANIHYVQNYIYNFDFRFFFQLNETLVGLETKNFVMIIGSNLRLEAPLLNARLRNNFLHKLYFSIYTFGLGVSYLTYPVNNLGNALFILFKFFEGSFFISKSFLNTDVYNLDYLNYILRDFNIFIGLSYLQRLDGQSLLFSLLLFLESQYLSVSNLNVISLKMGRLIASELGLISTCSSMRIAKRFIYNLDKSFIYFCGLDLTLLPVYLINSNSFIVFQGSFFVNMTLTCIKLILPVSVYTENELSYLNMEGRYRKSTIAVAPY